MQAAFLLAALLAGALVVTACSSTEMPAAPPHKIATTAVATPVGKVEIISAADGDVATVVQAAVTAQRARGRQLVVYVGARWCEPCQRFHQAAAAGKLDATFPTLTLLEFDLDRDSERLATAGYVSQLIPLFAVPAADGRASDRRAEGGIKGEGAVDFLSPRLAGLLAPP